MIQVIERVFKILEELSMDGEVSLKSLAEITGLNKGTLCNILGTLIKLGYVRRSRGGHYELTNRFADLSRQSSFSPNQLAFLHDSVTALAEETEESGVLTELHGDKVSILFQAQHQHALMINTAAIYSSLSLYHSVSGRILFAWQTPETQAGIIRRTGMPLEEWDGISTMEELKKACRIIRRKRVSIMENRASGIIALAVPVELSGNHFLSLGLTVPLIRCNMARRKTILRLLLERAQQIVTDIDRKHG